MRALCSTGLRHCSIDSAARPRALYRRHSEWDTGTTDRAQQGMPAGSSETSDTEPPGRWRLTSLVRAALWPWRQATDERDRWILWVPVFIGTGVAGYFGLAIEPPIW